MDEDAITGAKRELKEETGLEDAFIEQFYTFSEVGRDPRGRVITIAHYALVRTQEVKGGDDAAQARWFSIPEVPPLAFDHDRILRLALDRLREKIHFAPVGFELLPEEFTMPQLQNLYESIKNEPFKIPEDDGNDLTHTFFNPDREGWLLKLGERRRRGRDPAVAPLPAPAPQPPRRPERLPARPEASAPRGPRTAPPSG